MSFRGTLRRMGFGGNWCKEALNMGCKGYAEKVKYWNEVQRVYFEVYLINGM